MSDARPSTTPPPATSETSDAFGPIELFVVAFDGTDADRGVLDALDAVGAQGHVRLVDLVVAARLADGTLRISEAADLGIAVSGELGLAAEGLIGDDDVSDAAEGLLPGTGVALAALEMRWAAGLAARLAAAGGHVAHVALIPAPAVNELISTALTTTGSD